MTAGPQQRVTAFLHLAREDLAAAKLLVTVLPRHAAYNLQQSVEKLARAVLAHEAIPFGNGHSLGMMAAALPEDHPWRAELMIFDSYSSAATKYRYSTPQGRILPPPSEETLRRDIAEIEALTQRIEAWRSG